MPTPDRTARSSSTSRSARCAGSRTTTSRPTRRSTTSRSTVPGTSTVFGNGKLASTTSSGSQSTWHWREDSPMATLPRDRDERRLPAHDRRHEPRHHRSSTASTRRRSAALRCRRSSCSPGMVDFLADELGAPYPFTSSGGVVDVVRRRLRAREPDAADVRAPLATDTTVAHEMAHQWFGNSVSPAHVGGHLAQRGAGGVLLVAVGRARERRRTTTEQRSTTFYADARLRLERPARRAADRGRHLQHRRDVQPRRDGHGGAAPDHRRARSSSRSAARGSSSTPTATRRPPTSSRSSRPRAASTRRSSTSSSSSGSTRAIRRARSPTSRPTRF